jgi:dienelactone hydrolase
VGANKPFKDLALGLATKGVAVLRYDKRTRVYGSRMVADKDLAGSLTVKEEVIDDALQAVEVLRRAERVDPGRIFLLGHSLGGYLIPRIAAADVKGEIAGFIIMAGATRPLEDMMVEQVTYILGLAGGGGEDGRRRLAELKTQRDRVKALSESDVASGERIMNAGVRYWLDLRGYDPPELAKRIERPILVVQGERDYQVTASKDFAGWKAALAGRPGVTFKLYPKLNHLFIEGQGFPSPSEYTLTIGHIPAAVIDDLAGWILGRGPIQKPSQST